MFPPGFTVKSETAGSPYVQTGPPKVNKISRAAPNFGAGTIIKY